MDRTWLAIGSALMFLAVAFGAFHALALIAVSLLAPRTGAVVQVAGVLFAAGIVIFSGSLYALALTGTRWLGAITPIGGLLLLAGWLTLVWAAVVARTGA